MLRPVYDKNRRGQVATVQALPFPWRGLNLRDRLEAKNPEYAQILDNWIVEKGEGRLRYGFQPHATDMPAQPTRSLMVYSGGGNDQMFAASDGKIYNATSAGAVGAPDISGLGSDVWINVMYATTSGTYLVMANGIDDVRHFNGAVWATPSITNVTSSTLSHVSAHKGRLWFVEKNTLNAWYLATNAVAGAATKFPIGALCKRGGILIATATWSSDAGDGLDDRLALITSEGELLVYEGSDPANDYSLVGIFQVDRPVSNKCFSRYGGDLIIATQSGPVATTEVMTAKDPQDGAFAEKVRPAFLDLWRAYSALYGWEAISYNSRGWLIFNCPVSTGLETAYQYVFNDGAWFRFRWMGAACWAEMGGHLYFGGAEGGVFQADDPSADGDDGDGIAGDIQWAWWHFGSAAKKRFTMARIFINADVEPVPTVEMITDYSAASPAVPVTLSSVVAATWDEADWAESAWAESFFTYQAWIGLANIGSVGALRFRVSTKGQTIYNLQSILVTLETGGAM